MTREEYDALCIARSKLCDFCEADECTFCIVTLLIDQAYTELPDEDKDDIC